MVDSLHFRRRNPAAGRLSVAIRDMEGESTALRDDSQPPSPTLSVVDGCEAVPEQRRL